jgi:biopolymer transport protein TolR
LNVARSLPERGEERYIPLAEISVTPMVDVMIMLLIFMVAAPLLTAEVPVNLLKTSAAQVTRPQELRVGSMKAAGETFIVDNQVASDDLKTPLSTLGAQDPTRIIYVRGDREIQYGTLMDLPGLVNTAAFAKVSLLSESFEPAVTPP